MANTITDTGTRTGIFFTANDKALMKKLQKVMSTTLYIPNRTAIIREGLLALAQLKGVK